MKKQRLHLSNNKTVEKEYARLSTEEKNKVNADLCTRYQNGDNSAAERLIVLNRPFVINIAKRYIGYMGSDLDMDDLIQEGCIGVLSAAKRVDVSRGYSFLTYAEYWIRQKIVRANVDQGHAVRLPVHLHDRIVKMNLLDGKYQYMRPRERKELIANIMGISLEALDELYKFSELIYLARADKPLMDNEDMRLEDFFEYSIENTQDADPFNEVIIRDLAKNVREIMDECLSNTEHKVISLRFGLDGKGERTLEDVGKEFNVTRERIRQIEAKALRKMRYPSRWKRLACYLTA